jgi:hypothetical protein
MKKTKKRPSLSQALIKAAKELGFKKSCIRQLEALK